MTGSTAPGPQDGLDPAQDGIIAEMAGLDDGLATYEYLVRLGKNHRPDEDGLRHDRYSVSGCQSRVWVRTELRGGHVHILADSDATITRGIIALLLRVLDGRSPAEIVASELYFLDRTGLSHHLSPARSNGLHAIVHRIRSFAETSMGEA